LAGRSWPPASVRFPAPTHHCSLTNALGTRGRHFGCIVRGAAVVLAAAGILAASPLPELKRTGRQIHYLAHPPKGGTGEPRPAFLWINRSAEPPHAENLSTGGSSFSGRGGASRGSRSRARKAARRLPGGRGRAQTFSAARQSTSSASEASAGNRTAAPCRSRATGAPSRRGARK